MPHVHGHSGNLGNACADHAAALGSLGLLSSHNDATLWVQHNFDISACCEGGNSISEILERLDRIRTEAVSLSPNGNQLCVLHRVCSAFLLFDYVSMILLSLFFPCIQLGLR